MADWEKDIGMLKTDVKYIREDIGVMQKQIRDLNKTSHMGLGGIKVFLIIGGILGFLLQMLNAISSKKRAKWNDYFGFHNS